ncbi:MAG: hypothetical protein ACK5YR_23940 [Pirellula sp.]
MKQQDENSVIGGGIDVKRRIVDLNRTGYFSPFFLGLNPNLLRSVQVYSE